MLDAHAHCIVHLCLGGEASDTEADGGMRHLLIHAERALIEQQGQLFARARDGERLAAALEWKEAELQRAKRDKVQRGAHFVRQARILKRFMQAALVGDKGLSDEDLDSEIQAVEQMRGRDGQIALKAKAC